MVRWPQQQPSIIVRPQVPIGMHGPLLVPECICDGGIEGPDLLCRGSAPWEGYCHNLFPELSPSDTLLLLSFGFTPLLSLRTPKAMLIGSNHTRQGPLGLITLHSMLWPE